MAESKATTPTPISGDPPISVNKGITESDLDHCIWYYCGGLRQNLVRWLHLDEQCENSTYVAELKERRPEYFICLCVFDQQKRRDHWMAQSEYDCLAKPCIDESVVNELPSEPCQCDCNANPEHDDFSADCPPEPCYCECSVDVDEIDLSSYCPQVDGIQIEDCPDLLTQLSNGNILIIIDL